MKLILKRCLLSENCYKLGSNQIHENIFIQMKVMRKEWRVFYQNETFLGKNSINLLTNFYLEKNHQTIFCGCNFLLHVINFIGGHQKYFYHRINKTNNLFSNFTELIRYRDTIYTIQGNQIISLKPSKL